MVWCLCPDNWTEADSAAVAARIKFNFLHFFLIDIPSLREICKNWKNSTFISQEINYFTIASETRFLCFKKYVTCGGWGVVYLPGCGTSGVMGACGTGDVVSLGGESWSLYLEEVIFIRACSLFRNDSWTDVSKCSTANFRCSLHKILTSNFKTSEAFCSWDGFHINEIAKFFFILTDWAKMYWTRVE